MTIDQIVSHLAAMQTSTDTALTNLLKQVPGRIVANAAARANIYPTPVAGNKVYRTDLGYAEEYNGTSWVALGKVSAMPFAMAAGRGSNPNGSYATVNFPTGRFTQPPVITAITFDANVALMNTGTVTKDNAQIAGFTTSGNAMAASWQWIAVQMTPTSAVG